MNGPAVDLIGFYPYVDRGRKRGDRGILLTVTLNPNIIFFQKFIWEQWYVARYVH